MFVQVDMHMYVQMYVFMGKWRADLNHKCHSQKTFYLVFLKSLAGWKLTNKYRPASCQAAGIYPTAPRAETSKYYHP